MCTRVWRVCEQVASVRIHIEREIERLRRFKLLQRSWPWNEHTVRIIDATVRGQFGGIGSPPTALLRLVHLCVQLACY